MNVLVTGAYGQLGSEIRRLSKEFPILNICYANSIELDIINTQQIRRFVRKNKIGALVNCAAYTAVDRAEIQPEYTALINTQGPHNLSFVAKEFNLRFIHISTDYVFDGKANTPYLEDDLTNPVGVYGRTKLEGEKRVMGIYPKSIIIRTSWLYSSYGNNFVKTMLRMMQSGTEVGVIADQIGTPTYAADLAYAILKILLFHDFNMKSGIYHFSNEGVASWYDFAQAVHEMTGASCMVKPLTSREYHTKAERPAYSVLDKSKIKKAFYLKVPYWRNSLRECLAYIYREKI
nr:dTDP-4-dehydrorhamnose reductase [uncultured Draconibacterium sp.]